MNSRDLYEAIGRIDDRYLDFTEDTNMKHFNMRKTLIAALAACLCLCLLTGTAMAAGWIPNIFKSVPDMPQTIIDGAVQTDQTDGPDWSKLTVTEQFYDGRELAIGFTWDKSIPAPRANVELRAEQIARAKYPAGNYYATYTDSPNGIETLDYLKEIDYFPAEDVQDILDNRSEKAKEHDLQNWSAILLDWQLKELLSPEDYAAFWQQLEATGSATAMCYNVYIGDHIYVNGADMFELLNTPGREPGDSGILQEDTDKGSVIRLTALPEAARDKDSVTVELKVKCSAVYYYMELDGHAYDLYEPGDAYNAAFTVTR